MASHGLTSRDVAAQSDASELLDSLRRIVRHLRLVARESEAKAGLAPAQAFVLSRLAEGPAASIRELAERTMTDPSSVSVVLDKLEKRGFVARSADPADKRRTQLSLTPLGKRALSRTPELPQVHLLSKLAQLPKARRRAMVKALSELVVVLGAAETKPELFFEETSPKKRGRRGA
jgi:DNA-binding MarR family transcriptional regulator